jgi:hypothetical protein
MNYPETPDAAQATVTHRLDGSGNAASRSPGNSPPVPCFPKPINAVAAAMTGPANTTPSVAGDAARASQ